MLKLTTLNFFLQQTTQRKTHNLCFAKNDKISERQEKVRKKEKFKIKRGDFRIHAKSPLEKERCCVKPAHRGRAPPTHLTTEFEVLVPESLTPNRLKRIVAPSTFLVLLIEIALETGLVRPRRCQLALLNSYSW